MKRDEQDDAQRLETAADWMLRLRDETASEAEILRWMQWCEADARNQSAFNRVQQVWALSGRLAGEVRNGELVCAGSAPRVEPATQRPAWLDWLNDLAAPRRIVSVGLAGAAVVAIGALWSLRGDLGRPDGAGPAAVVPAEPVQEARLADGSTVELAAQSTIAVHYSERERALELQGGEAYFSVAPDARRPFIVSAGAIRVRAIGTAFNVRRAGDRVVVTVMHGKVDVYRAGEYADEVTGAAASEGGHAVRVSPGSRVIWDAASPNPVVASVKPSSALAWREGRLEYTSEPLAAVIADFNRYSKRPVIIRGDAIRSLRFSGTLLTNATEEWLYALPGQFPVRIEEQDDAYVIHPREPWG